MNILFLGYDCPLIDWLRKRGHKIIQHEVNRQTDFIISYGYRHKLPKDILDRFPRRAINLHVGYLPWNRGADPNFWSVVQDTPCGVTIHLMDEGIDTGPIISNKLIETKPGDTFATRYARLRDEMEKLFMLEWPMIEAGGFRVYPQNKEAGSHHRSADKEIYRDLLTRGWDTPIDEFVESLPLANDVPR